MASLTPLATACSEGNVNLVETMLNANPTPSQGELDGALERATWAGHIEPVRLLLSQGARLNRMSFIGVVRSRDPAMFEELLQHGWDINSTEFGSPALR